MHSSEEISAALCGPSITVRTPFTQNGDIDDEGLHRYLDCSLASGVRTLLLTYGDSLYSLLTDAEIAHVTRTVLSHVAGRAMVVAADGGWWTGKAVEFARFCREHGADLIMVLPPDWTHSATPETLAAHYAAVGVELPVMMVTTYLRNRTAADAQRIVDAVRRHAANVVAVKEDVGGEVGEQICAAVTPDLAVVAGGTKRLHARLADRGASGYLSVLALFNPTLARRYWVAVQTGDRREAESVIREVDVPMFELLSRFPGGFDAALHGWCEILGIYGRWRRSPYRSLEDAELDQLESGLHDLGLLDNAGTQG